MTQDPGPADLLLEWYDHGARRLPWRVGPADRVAGVRPDPYQVWLSEIMLQQTTVAGVAPFFRRFLHKWPNVAALAAAPEEEVLAAWAGLGYYARARNLIRCARQVAVAHGGRFPEAEDALRELPGVGPYTAAAVAAIAFDAPAVVVDGNVERVVARLRRIETPLPDAKPAIRAAAAELTPERRPGDYAQAVMDLGATICTPRRPACGLCPWRGFCAAHAAGVAETLPTKRAKAPKPTRFGAAFLLLRADGALLLQKRPDSGLLGGMTGLPSTDWRETAPAPAEIAAARPAPGATWRPLGVTVRHTFTHFHLALALEGARLADARSSVRLGASDRWVAPDDLAAAALPTLMKKAVRSGLEALGAGDLAD